jgi:hypothetical protein
MVSRFEIEWRNDPIDACPPNLQHFCSLSGPQALSLHGADLRDINRRRPPFVRAFRLGSRNSFKLTFATEVSLEFCEHSDYRGNIFKPRQRP